MKADSIDRPRNGHEAVRRFWSTWTTPIAVIVLAGCLILIAAITYGATRPNIGNPPAPIETSASTSRPILMPTHQLQPSPDQPSLTELIEKVDKRYSVTSGIAIFQLADPYQASQEPWTGGIEAMPAYETIALPIAAALKDDESRAPADTRYLFNRAITHSSQAATQAMWEYLGAPHQAEEKITDALHRYGDFTTSLDYLEERTLANAKEIMWRLDDQTRFMAGLGCNYYESIDLLSAMNDPRSQAWGMEYLPASYSYGSLHEQDRRWNARQVGLIWLKEGPHVALAIAVEGASSEREAREAMTDLAYGVRDQARGIHHSQCVI